MMRWGGGVLKHKKYIEEVMTLLDRTILSI